MRGSWIALALLGMTLVGCSGSGPSGPTGTVAGTLTKQGKTLSTETSVVFVHNESGAAAFGTTAEDGSYKIASPDSDQVPVGMYRVMIQPPASSLAAEDEPSPEELLDNPALSRPAKNQNEFSFKYRQLSTSGLQFEVTEGPNQIDIDLK